MECTSNKILLASNSPRRRELLSKIQSSFEIAHLQNIEEIYPSSLSPDEIPMYLSRLKSESYYKQLDDNEILITADTVVICGDKALGKPKDREEAIEMLKSLRDRTHLVVTGVTLTSNIRTESFSETTEVTFGHLSDDEITDYVNNFKPYDKAGAYGIQEWVGCVGITGIKGCFYNVMGLPLHSLYHHLKNF